MKREAPAAARNREPILDVLRRHLPREGLVLEFASGTGQHVVTFARLAPDIVWWPSDFNEQHLKSIAAWRAHAGLPNIRPPLRIDLSDPDWRPESPDGTVPQPLLGLFCANVVHIAPWRDRKSVV